MIQVFSLRKKTEGKCVHLCCDPSTQQRQEGWEFQARLEQASKNVVRGVFRQA